jgi:aspartyl-tRNA(Asn)/glutamyl-tRNA(Gln) amidotransferase subunit A
MTALSPWLDLVGARDLVARREVTAVALLESILAQIDAMNPSVNAFVTVMADEAYAQAQKADRDLAQGRSQGPLHGVTLGVKDIIDVERVPTRAGSRSMEDIAAPRDAACVARLRAAGAIVLGKLHTHELAAGITSDNALFGRARNPWNPTFIPGGSSGGSAIATAAGMVHCALGSDTGGSIRIPAAFCGVVGLKGTLGRVSRRGVLTRSWTMDHVGPLTRTVRDAALVFEAMAGHDAADEYSSRRPVGTLADALGGDLRGIRAGLLTGSFFESDVDREVASAFEAATTVIRSRGATLRGVAFDLAEAAHAAGYVIAFAEAAAVQADRLCERPEDFGADVRAQLRAAEFISATQYLRALSVRSRVQEAIGRLLIEVDVLLLPTVPIMPLRCTETPSSEKLLLCARNTRLFSVAGVPAITIPAGFSREGLPIGLQIVGRPFDEATIVRVADAYERATSWHLRRPALAATSSDPPVSGKLGTAQAEPTPSTGEIT